MSTLTDELINLTEQVSTLTALPAVEQVILPLVSKTSVSNPPLSDPGKPATPSKYSKFGLLILQDGSAGFFYCLLDNQTCKNNNSAELTATILSEIQGKDPVSVAGGLRSTDPLSRGLGMAAINAVSQFVFSKCGYQPFATQRGASFTHQFTTQADTRVGMVGYFAPMVKALQAKAVPTTVIELDESLYQESETLLVTGDMTQLEHCNPIYCTASTLLNDSLENILLQLPRTAHVEVIGPTCGCFADPFFKRGVDCIGSSAVVNIERAKANMSALEPWGDSVEKYAISATDYPGFDALAARLKAGC